MRRIDCWLVPAHDTPPLFGRLPDVGYVPTDVLGNGADTADWSIEILIEMRPAKLQLEPLFDPKAERMRG